MNFNEIKIHKKYAYITTFSYFGGAPLHMYKIVRVIWKPNNKKQNYSNDAHIKVRDIFDSRIGLVKDKHEFFIAAHRLVTLAELALECL